MSREAIVAGFAALDPNVLAWMKEIQTGDHLLSVTRGFHREYHVTHNRFEDLDAIIARSSRGRSLQF